jgi:hypothetical protein
MIGTMIGTTDDIMQEGRQQGKVCQAGLFNTPLDTPAIHRE